MKEEHEMDIFTTVKAAVTVRQAAEHYGLQVSRNGMTCCPFHDDRHPSMKLNERYFYCFGCGVTGDVIDLVARLFDLSSYEAAQMTRLTKQKAKLEELLAGIGAFNAKSKAAEIAALLDKYIPAVEQMHSTLKKYQVAFTETTVENKKLKQEKDQLEQSLEKVTQESTLKQLADAKLRRDYADAVTVLDRIPKEVLDAYTRGGHGRKERPIEQNL